MSSIPNGKLNEETIYLYSFWFEVQVLDGVALILVMVASLLFPYCYHTVAA